MNLIVKNTGEIEVDALFLIGATSKEGDASKIGFFGSGNKYALATLLRNGIGLRVFSGTREIAITKEPVVFRGEHFEQIIVDGKPTSFTTRMGPSWEVWFALREIICNAMDEGGLELGLTSAVEPRVGETLFAINATSEVMDFFGKIEQYIFLGEAMFEAESTYDKVAIVRRGVSELNVYRKGICILARGRHSKALFHYNFEDIDINESRVAEYEYQIRERIATALALAPEEIVAEFLAHVHEDNLAENAAMWEYVKDDFSEAWRSCLADCTIMDSRFIDYAPAEDVASAVVLPSTLVEKLKNQFPQLHFYGLQGGQYAEVVFEGDAIARACAEVEGYGYLDPGITVKTVLFEKHGILASYCRQTNVIAVDVRGAEDYDELVTTIVEEGLHVRGYRDGSRDFEQYLMRELVKAKREAAK